MLTSINPGVTLKIFNMYFGGRKKAHKKIKTRNTLFFKTKNTLK